MLHFKVAGCRPADEVTPENADEEEVRVQSAWDPMWQERLCRGPSENIFVCLNEIVRQ